MHAAPPVRMSLVPDRAWEAVWIVGASVAGANVAAWAAVHGGAPAQTAAMAALLVAAVVGMLVWGRHRRHRQAGILNWDGATWQWSSGATEAREGQVRVMVDLGAWLLLRFVAVAPPHPVAWLTLARGNAGVQWPAWRAAVYARRTAHDVRSTGETA